MPVNVTLLASAMLTAARGVGLGASDWIKRNPMVQVQLSGLAAATADIDRMLRLGSIGEARARELYEGCQNGIKSVLLGYGAEPLFLDKLLVAATKAIRSPIGSVVTAGTVSTFKAGKDL